MEIPLLTIELSKSNLISLINRIITEKNIYVSSIELSNNLILNGSLIYKSLKLSFITELSIEIIELNTIKLEFNNFNFNNMVLPKHLKSLIIKHFLSKIHCEGIVTLENAIIINLVEFFFKYEIIHIEISKIETLRESIILILKNINTRKPLDNLISLIV